VIIDFYVDDQEATLKWYYYDTNLVIYWSLSFLTGYKTDNHLEVLVQIKSVPYELIVLHLRVIHLLHCRCPRMLNWNHFLGQMELAIK
jgi:hypothetical protein